MSEHEQAYEEIAEEIGSMNARDLMQEFRIHVGGDCWGTTMAWWFAVAGEMWERGLAVPDVWKYRASPFGPRS